MNILLMGLTASGKTIVGRLLAKSLSCEFIDLDERISKKATMCVRLFYEKYGKKAFQELEADVLKDCLKEIAFSKKTFVISSGGGLVENTNAIFILKEYSHVQIFFLYNKPKILFNRLLKKAKKEHSLPAFLIQLVSKDFHSQIKHARKEFLSIYKKRMKLLNTIDCIKVKSKGMNTKKIIGIIKRRAMNTHPPSKLGVTQSQNHFCLSLKNGS